MHGRVLALQMVLMAGTAYDNDDADLHPRQWRRAARAQREVAHLALRAARVAAPPPAGDAFLQDLFQHALMKGDPLPRGE